MLENTLLTVQGSTPVVFLGSLGTDHSMWDPQVRHLSRRHSTMAVDLRGHGASPAPPGPYSMTELADDVRATIDGAELGTCHLVGLSLGGAVAQELVIAEPHRFHSLTLIATADRFREAHGWLDRAATVRASGMGEVASAVIDRWFTPGFNGTADRERCLAMLRETPAEGYAGCCEALAGWTSGDRLSGITVPTLVIAGAEDPATPPTVVRKLALEIPRSEFRVLSPAAHLANREQPTAVNELLADHLERNDPDPRPRPRESTSTARINHRRTRSHDGQ
ncbi:3-oxoadipate enol-lactonase [Corynebacterium sp. TAE3-ERU16]|uniref:3-oxoadipate enol-lactonase n=1 Tax=Corynebacterium sp. TAE3-ERU16 TaxID=2849493 RepID=UPI001C448A93|nr:3-oxoadipate enol-lactonase [Corynebacterium sp. TAE3-ERU16]MBV7292941.1 3-oxoadipate enol-lactonase [Corynebacterium sp. TAE3-ERU16]